jgi:hypothetical protein
LDHEIKITPYKACHNPFLGYSPNSFLFLKKKTQNNVVLNNTVLLFPLDVQQGKKKPFLKSSFPAHSLSLSPLTQPIPCHHYGRNRRPMPDHYTLCLDRVGWPSPPASYKYRGRTKDKKGGLFFEKEENKREIETGEETNREKKQRVERERERGD